jgi:formyltetrahydrofolate hydrolase
VLTFRCDDQLGVVSTLADVIQEHRANVISLDLMIGALALHSDVRWAQMDPTPAVTPLEAA